MNKDNATAAILGAVGAIATVMLVMKIWLGLLLLGAVAMAAAGGLSNAISSWIKPLTLNHARTKLPTPKPLTPLTPATVPTYEAPQREADPTDDVREDVAAALTALGLRYETARALTTQDWMIRELSDLGWVAAARMAAAYDYVAGQGPENPKLIADILEDPTKGPNLIAIREHSVQSGYQMDKWAIPNTLEELHTVQPERFEAANNGNLDALLVTKEA